MIYPIPIVLSKRHVFLTSDAVAITALGWRLRLATGLTNRFGKRMQPQNIARCYGTVAADWVPLVPTEGSVTPSH